MLNLYITFNSEKKCLDIAKSRSGNRAEIWFHFGLGVYGEELLPDDLGPTLRTMISEISPRWIQAGDYGFIINFDALREEIGSAPELDRWTGSSGFTPKNIVMTVNTVADIPGLSLKEYVIKFSFPPDFGEDEGHLIHPPLISDSLRRFKKDYPQMNYRVYSKETGRD